MSERGIIFVATGPVYVALAERAAASCKEWMPDIEVDFFTDVPVDKGPFDQVNILADPWKRSKIDALSLSRFEKTIFLDADVLAVDSFVEVFDVLDRCDICGVHDQLRNTWNAQKIWRVEVPSAFPQINTGMIGYRRSDAVLALFREWSAAVRENKFWRDQPVFRELIWESDLRFITLPEEFNYMGLHTLKAFSDRNAGPRLVHCPQFHHKAEDGERIVPLEELLGPDLMALLTQLREKRHSMQRQAKRRSRNL